MFLIDETKKWKIKKQKKIKKNGKKGKTERMENSLKNEK